MRRFGDVKGMDGLRNWIGCSLVVGVLVWGATFSANAEPKLPSNLTQTGGGGFVFGDRAFSLAHFDASWRRVDQTDLKIESGYPRVENGEWKTRGLMKLSENSSLLVEESLRSIEDGSILVRYDVEKRGDIPTESLCVATSLPIDASAGRGMRVNGALLALPRTFEDTVLFTGAANEIALPGASGEIFVSGGKYAYAQDDRRWGGEAFQIRIPLIRMADESRYSIELTLREAPYESWPLSIKAQANRAWKDAVSADGKGGWTDQGPLNDMSVLPTGPLTLLGIKFDLLPADSADARSCIVLTGRDLADDGFLREVAIPAEGRPPAALYLLHASAWLPDGNGQVGLIEAVFEDGTVEQFPIRANREVGDWWGPVPLPNGAVGWTGLNRSSNVGLYISRFDLPGKPLREVRLKGSGRALWMVAGLSVSNDRIQLPSNQPVVIKVGGAWVPFPHRLDIDKGSIFDFSFLNDGAAGRFGFLKVSPAGRFEFENKPGEIVRFWGVNLCFEANFPSHELADRVADRLARSGYNVVRLHHFDAGLVRPGGKSYELDPVRLDRLEYLIAALKKRGIYVSIDLYSMRKFREDEIPDLGRDFDHEIKQLIPLSDKAFDSWQRFAKAILQHVNPYTGLSLANDPVLVGICPVNEDSPLELPHNDDPLSRLYRQAFERWKDGQPAEVVSTHPAAELRFLMDLHLRTDDRLRKTLRGLGVKAPITGANFHELEMLTLARERYDYVDTHMYWDHPLFVGALWKLPFRFNQTSSVRYESSLPRLLMPTRVLGRPFTVTEFNFVMPNMYRAEGALLAPSYASLQGWDAMFNFDYASSDVRLETIGIGGLFDLSTDPIGMLADRFSALVFRRGDVRPASTVIGFVPSESRMFGVEGTRPRDFPREFSRLGLVARIGVLPTEGTENPGVKARVFDDAALLKKKGGDRDYLVDGSLVDRLVRDGVLPAGSLTDKAGSAPIKSETGELEIDPSRGVFALSTLRSAGFVLPGNEGGRGSFLRVKNGPEFGVFCVASVDGKPLVESRRILLLHLTDVLTDGMKFNDTNRRLLADLGAMPHLAKRATAWVELALPAGDWKAWSVRTDGSRVREIPLSEKDGWRVLHLDTAAGDGAGFSYEFSREENPGT